MDHAGATHGFGDSVQHFQGQHGIKTWIWTLSQMWLRWFERRRIMVVQKETVPLLLLAIYQLIKQDEWSKWRKLLTMRVKSTMSTISIQQAPERQQESCSK
jgi:hypothetical protein